MATEASRKQPKRKGTSLSTERILNTNSPVGRADVDLLPFFYTCIKDWDTLYNEVEKQAIISTLPVEYRKIEKDGDGQILCPISSDFVSTDQFFRDGMARFQRDVGDGYWTATWRKNAMKASDDRANGKFDEYLQQCVDETFGDAADTFR